MSMINGEALRVAIYARYSTDRQDSRSIEDQMRRCRAYAAGHGQTVVAEYSDAAISGAHVERADMQRMLAATRAKGGASFRAVLVDDLSRLSRDLGNTWQIVFHDLASANVKVIDVTTGMASDGAGARLTFGAMALVNDTFLQLVRAETHRGLEGRALGGFSTGGQCYGYRTVQEDRPPDPEHPRRRGVVVPDEAAIVVRIFSEYVDGRGPKKIAIALNEERIPAPYDGRGNKCAPGWASTTVRAMLKNQRYVGKLLWNQSKWVRTPGAKGRRRVMRPESEWVTVECPELAIVSRDLWDAAQTRFERMYSNTRGRPAGTGRRVCLVSGFMRCGVCGGRMTIVGTRTKRGVCYGRFGCSTNHSKGEVVCSNGLSISDRKASAVLLKVIRDKLAQPEEIDRLLTPLGERIAQLSRDDSGDELQKIEQDIVDCERRIANLTEALAKLGWSDALGAKLKAEEAQLSSLRTTQRSARNSAPRRLVADAAAIVAQVREMLAVLETNPTRGRELLSRFVSPIVMSPVVVSSGHREYRATGAFNLGYFVGLGTDQVADKGSCAGAQSPLDHGELGWIGSGGWDGGGLCRRVGRVRGARELAGAAIVRARLGRMWPGV